MGIFISYSHHDMVQVRQIAQQLRDNSGHGVWFDNALRGGDNFFSVITEEILKNEYFVFIVSAGSCCSDWCVRELQFAMSERKKIIAVFLDDITPPPVIRLIIQNIHHICWYLLTEPQFNEEIRRAFADDSVWTPDKPADGTPDREFEHRDEEKYFLTEEESRKIPRLLQLEKNGSYAECFRPENAVLLGLAYETGIHADRDLRKAEFYYKVGTHRENQDARYLLAALMAEKDPDNIRQYAAEMAAAAGNGSVFAMTYWGDANFYGLYGLPVDQARAVSFWKKAADLGSPRAQYNMAFSYRCGEGVQKDPGLALMYALCATEQHFPRAYRLIGFLYKFGEFVQKDTDKATQYFQKAIKLGDHKAVVALADILFEDHKYEEAVALYRRGAELADAGEALSGYVYYCLGYCYYKGRGCHQDLRTAIEYYLKSAARKNEVARKYVVSMIEALPDPDERLELLKRAAELNCRNAEYTIGNLLETKRISGEIKKQVLDWWKQGAEKGSINCILRLLTRLSIGLYDTAGAEYEPDHLLALKYFRMLFSLPKEDGIEDWDDHESISGYYYGYACELENDIHPDTALSLYYFQKALDKNPRLLDRIVGIAINRFLIPEQWNLPMEKDIPHCLEILRMADACVPRFLTAVQDPALRRTLLSQMVKGYDSIAQCYKKGDSVPRDRSQSALCREKAEKYRDLLAEYSE